MNNQLPKVVPARRAAEEVDSALEKTTKKNTKKSKHDPSLDLTHATSSKGKSKVVNSKSELGQAIHLPADPSSLTPSQQRALERVEAYDQMTTSMIASQLALMYSAKHVAISAERIAIDERFLAAFAGANVKDIVTTSHRIESALVSLPSPSSSTVEQNEYRVKLSEQRDKLARIENTMYKIFTDAEDRLRMHEKVDDQ
ncbi:hypothetical protein I204_02837 [Kwoniella mangroviensis CBS 8886]|nr:hypothetical protein I204_02837 [Kwoniella mangroviensis CBS 8886]